MYAEKKHSVRKSVSIREASGDQNMVTVVRPRAREAARSYPATGKGTSGRTEEKGGPPKKGAPARVRTRCSGGCVSSFSFETS